MREATWLKCVVWLSLVAWASVASSVAAHELEVDIGALADFKLRIHHHIPLPIVLPVSTAPTLPGFASGAMGIHSLAANDPSHGLFTLLSFSDIRLVLVSSDPNIHLITGTGPLQPGQFLPLGNPDFDLHPLFYLSGGTPGVPYNITFRAEDAYGYYTNSDPVTLSFTPVPEAGVSTFLMLLASWLGLVRRQRAQAVRC